MGKIELKNVTKEYRLYSSENARFKSLFSEGVRYKKKVAVNDISFTVNSGEKVAIIGPNGSGKTTLLRMILGTVYPTSGDIYIDGRVSPAIEQTAGFDASLTGRENIRFKGQLLGLDDEENQKLTDKTIDFAELGDYIDQPLRTYSGAMKNKLGYSIGINMDVDILLMDESVTAGDGEFRKKCVKKICDILSEEGKSLILATHSPKLAKKYCSRGLIIEKGKIVFDGPIDEAVEFYRNSAVKETIAEDAEPEEREEDTDEMDV